MAHSAERHRPSHSLSPAASELASALVPAGRDRRVEVPLNEQILNLVTTLSERVKQLESKLDNVEPRKRPTPIGQDDGQTIPSLTEHLRPAKKARVHQIEAARSLPATKNSDPEAAHDSSSGQNGEDAEAEDAATVLEFLAWGRLKDSNLTSGVRDLTSAHDSTYPDKDVFQAAQTWSHSPTSIPSGQIFMEPLQIPQIQELLPNRTQVFTLFQYHADWLLFMHCAFHVQSFKGELDQFYNNENGVINMTSAGLQWAALLFAIICGSMTCAKPAQIAKWGFYRGMLKSAIDRILN